MCITICMYIYMYIYIYIYEYICIHIYIYEYIYIYICFCIHVDTPPYNNGATVLTLARQTATLSHETATCKTHKT